MTAEEREILAKTITGKLKVEGCQAPWADILQAVKAMLDSLDWEGKK